MQCLQNNGCIPACRQAGITVIFPAHNLDIKAGKKITAISLGKVITGIYFLISVIIVLFNLQRNISMKFVSSLKMRKIDKLAAQKFGIPSLILMENAGRSVADEVEKMLSKRAAQIIVFCGYGNNGGDGFVAARHLISRGYKLEVFIVGKPKNMSIDTKINFDILKKIDLKLKKVIHQRQIGSMLRSIKKAHLIIDAIFGIGMKGELDKFYCQLFEKINSSNIPILAIDIPSGLDADKGIALPIAIKAKKTVTMGLIKKGFLNLSAKKYLGEIVVGDISLPKQLR